MKRLQICLAVLVQRLMKVNFNKQKLNKMEVKNMLYAGLGLGNMVSKKTYEHYEKMVKEGKNNPQAGSALESFFETLDSQKQDVKDRVADAFQTMADKLGYIKIEDYEYLQKRIKTLEADLAKEQSKAK